MGHSRRARDFRRVWLGRNGAAVVPLECSNGWAGTIECTTHTALYGYPKHEREQVRAKRVERWRHSGGLTTADLAAELRINPRALTCWAWARGRERVAASGRFRRARRRPEAEHGRTAASSATSRPAVTRRLAPPVRQPQMDFTLRELAASMSSAHRLRAVTSQFSTKSSRALLFLSK